MRSSGSVSHKEEPGGALLCMGLDSGALPGSGSHPTFPLRAALLLGSSTLLDLPSQLARDVPTTLSNGGSSALN